jgi:hypothetical protein
MIKVNARVLTGGPELTPCSRCLPGIYYWGARKPNPSSFDFLIAASFQCVAERLYHKVVASA